MLENLLSSRNPLTKILIKAQKDVFSKSIGDNNSKTKGIGYDFVELREYVNGDDIKHIDWTISSKFGKPYTKVFQEQRELNIVIAPILCASINFGVKILKHDIVSEICALVAFSSVKQNNPFSAYICNEDTKLCVRNTKLLFNVKELVEKIHFYKTLTKVTNYKSISSKLYTQLKQKSLIFLIGDFFHTEEFDIASLALKHELIVIIVRDKFEEEPIRLGELNIIDPQTKISSLININKKESLKIKKDVLEHDTLFYTKLKKAGVKFVKIYTDEKPANKIISLMKSV